jgi:hypothetical protein
MDLGEREREGERHPHTQQPIGRSSPFRSDQHKFLHPPRPLKIWRTVVWLVPVGAVCAVGEWWALQAVSWFC